MSLLFIVFIWRKKIVLFYSGEQGTHKIAAIRIRMDWIHLTEDYMDNMVQFTPSQGVDPVLLWCQRALIWFKEQRGFERQIRGNVSTTTSQVSGLIIWDTVDYPSLCHIPQAMQMFHNTSKHMWGNALTDRIPPQNGSHWGEVITASEERVINKCDTHSTLKAS